MLYKTTSIIIGIQTSKAQTEALQTLLKATLGKNSGNIEPIKEVPTRKWLKDVALFSISTPEDKRSQLIEQILKSGIHIHYLSTKKIWEEENQKIKLPSSNGFKYFPLRSIVRFESSSNYTYVYFTTHRRIIIAKSLLELEDSLSSYGFCRIHHKHLINIAHIDEYQSGKGGTVILSDNSKVDVSVRKKKHFLNYLNSSHK